MSTARARVNALSHRSYIVITPVRNEADFVGRTIASMAAQTTLPQQWVMVDDGSTDGTLQILQAAAHNYRWVTVVVRPDRGFRQAGGGVVEAFYDGYAAVRESEWDFLVKLDGDLSFAPDYFERCLARFDAEPQLGIGGGTVCVTEDDDPRVDSPGDPPFHVRGATKIYRRACWDVIHPLAPAPGWDTIDEVRANMMGWRTCTFQDVDLFQHRATGTVDGAWRNWVKNGYANYLTGYHPAFMFAKCLRRAWREPRLVAAAGLLAGFYSGYLKRVPRAADAATVRYLRQQQVRCLTLRASIYRASALGSVGEAVSNERG